MPAARHCGKTELLPILLCTLCLKWTEETGTLQTSGVSFKEGEESLRDQSAREIELLARNDNNGETENESREDDE